MINHDKDGCIFIRGQKLLDKVHADGVPWMLWNWKRLKESVGAVAQWFVVSAEHALQDILFAIDAHAGPYVVAS